jgi:hypothetical protein
MVNEEIFEDVKCFSCHKVTDLELGKKILRHEECPHCGAAMHCCKMCKYYDISAYNECRESIAERIVDKEKPNFCEFFTLKGNSEESDDRDKQLELANSLFKK